MVPELKAGLTLRWQRRVTEEDILRFAEFSGDKGAHHVEKDARGRLLAHGLLTATLPTKLGGDVDFMARTMAFEFLRPAYSGDLLTCVGTVVSALPKPGRLKVRFAFEVANQDGELLLKGSAVGVIRDHKAGRPA